MPRTANTTVLKVEDNEPEVSATFSKRIPVNADPDASFDMLRAAVVDVRKNWITSKISDIGVLNNATALEVEGRELKLTSRGTASLMQQLRLNGLDGSLQTLEDKEFAQKTMQDVLDRALAQRSNSFLRVHTANVNGEDRIVHVASAKTSTVAELELFDRVREAADKTSFVPIRFDSELDSITMQLVQVDDTFDLTPAASDSHRFVGSERDTYKGMITVRLSETTKANEVSLGVYREICLNGTILGQQEDLSIRATKGTKTMFGKLLRGIFDLYAGQASKIKDNVVKLQNSAFDESSYMYMETLASDNNVIRPWNAYFEDDMKSYIGTATKEQAFQLLTERAHDSRIAPSAQLRFEQIGGLYLKSAV